MKTKALVSIACVLSVTTAFAAKTSVEMVKATDRIQDLDKVVAQVKKEATVSVLFPTMIPKPAGETKYFANRDEISAQNGFSYWINVDATVDCKGVKACNIGNLNARKDAAPEKLVDRKNKQITETVTLANNTQGYFTPGHPMGDFFPANIQWMKDGVLYSLTWSKDLKAKDEKAAMIEMANSAITNP